uniref:DUF295 domain-containing protein n=1 Tax=Heterorhabditis bacteriophora TaxID=37862 RepID=A0A1I7WR23_HETBA
MLLGHKGNHTPYHLCQQSSRLYTERPAWQIKEQPRHKGNCYSILRFEKEFFRLPSVRKLKVLGLHGECDFSDDDLSAMDFRLLFLHRCHISECALRIFIEVMFTPVGTSCVSLAIFLKRNKEENDLGCVGVDLPNIERVKEGRWNLRNLRGRIMKLMIRNYHFLFNYRMFDLIVCGMKARESRKCSTTSISSPVIQRIILVYAKNRSSLVTRSILQREDVAVHWQDDVLYVNVCKPITPSEVYLDGGVDGKCYTSNPARFDNQSYFLVSATRH